MAAIRNELFLADCLIFQTQQTIRRELPVEARSLIRDRTFSGRFLAETASTDSTDSKSDTVARAASVPWTDDRPTRAHTSEAPAELEQVVPHEN